MHGTGSLGGVPSVPQEREIQFGALKVFAAVAESHTLTHAAEQLGITQSAVSQVVAQLENITGTDLVVRRSRPIKLTPSGQVLRTHAEQILAHSRRMLKAVGTASAGGLQKLSIGCIASVGDLIADRLMEEIEPIASTWSLQTGYAAPITQAMLSRDLDILITADPLSKHSDLDRYPILRDPFVMLVSEQHGCDGEITPEYMARNYPFIRYSKQLRLGVLTDLILHRIAVDPVTRFEFDSTRSMLSFVQSGHGWAVSTALCIVQYPELLKGVRVLKLGNGANARDLSLLSRHNELGDAPQKIASLCRNIFDQDVLPRILAIAPWLKNQSRSITELPVI